MQEDEISEDVKLKILSKTRELSKRIIDMINKEIINNKELENFSYCTTVGIISQVIFSFLHSCIDKRKHAEILSDIVDMALQEHNKLSQHEH